MGEKNLVIVESPAKAKTIEKFLGKDYTVKSSFGHICDLSKKQLGIDIENGFEPKYEVSADKKKVVSDLKASATKAETVWLASDEDREGEAIAWHLKNTLKLSDDKTKRIVFHEITEPAILNAIANPRQVDMNLVMAQQSRRVLDRLVGFELSPVLWKKVAPKLSAGRVQSVALKLIVEREREIQNFKSTTYYRVTGDFHTTSNGVEQKISATLDRRFATQEEALTFLEKCRNSKVFKVEHIDTKSVVRTPAPPFTTSALQQEASRKLGMSVAQTMSIAQKLYEGGLITYMRTDSTNLSALAINTIKQVITEKYGADHSKVRQYKTHSKGAQEAHEAIRPTYANNAKIEGTAQEKRLYDLIWKRAIASQMADALLDKQTITIVSDNFEEKFICEGEQIKFDGFLKLYLEGRDDEQEEETQNSILPSINKGDQLFVKEVVAREKHSQHPARYSEASLVKKLEELGIGRPSTYAPTISTITTRGYVLKDSREGTPATMSRMIFNSQKDTIETEQFTELIGGEKNKFFPQDIGILVTDYLDSNFATILDYGFTAKIEEDFDKVAAGKKLWNKVIEDFYTPFHAKVETLEHEKGYVKTERVLGVDPKTNEQISVRLGKYGPIAQRGTNDSPTKSYASLLKSQSLETITLEEALELFNLPREAGMYNGEKLIAAIGRFGPYIKYGNKFVSIDKTHSPYTITQEEAIELINQKEQKAINSILLHFETEDIQVIDGQYGPYIKHAGKNYKISKAKAKNAKELTLEECKEIIAQTAPTSSRRGAKSSAKAKTKG